MSEVLELVVASANPDKTLELQELLAVNLGDRVRVLPRPAEISDIEETGETLEENALLKARTVAAAANKAAIADDTGLEVAALGGAPGVYSARYAGEDASYEDNVAKLRAAMEGRADRRAKFRTVCAIVFPDGSELVAEGAVDGEIVDSPSGGAGFGYDPLFRPLSEEHRTYAELTREEKNVLSHRGAAVRALAALLSERLDS